MPTQTLYQLEHYQLGHYDKPTRTLHQLGPYDYITNSDTTQTLLIGLLVEHSHTLFDYITNSDTINYYQLIFISIECDIFWFCHHQL